MPSSLSWPLDSPVSLGIILNCLAFFCLGVVFFIEPRWVHQRRVSYSALLEDQQMGFFLMWIFGVSGCLVLITSWLRSENTPPSALDAADPQVSSH